MSVHGLSIYLVEYINIPSAANIITTRAKQIAPTTKK